MTRAYGLRWAAVLLPWLVLGCGGSAQDPAHAPGAAVDVTGGAEVEGPAAPLEPLAILPPDAVAVVDVDVVSLRGSPHAERLLTWIAGTLEDPVAAQLGRDLFQRTHHVVLGLAPPDGDGMPRGVLVARGDLDPDDLPRLLPEGADVEFDAETGRAVHLHGPLAAAAFDDETWIFASPEQIGAALHRARHRPSGRGPLADPDLAAMADRIGFGGPGLTLVAHASPELRATLGDDRYFARSTTEALRVLGVSLRMEGGVDLELVAETTDAASARALSARASELTRWAGSHTVIALLGLRPLFDGVRVRTDETRAIAMLHLDDAYVAQLLSRAEALSGRLLEMGGQGAAAEAPAPPSD